MTVVSAEPEAARPSRRVMIALLCAWAVLSLNLAFTVARFQPNVLTWDQWDFFQPLFAGSGWRELFTLQHGPHRQGLGFIFTSWIMAATHWDSRWDSLWIAGLLSLATLLALRLRFKITGRLSVMDIWIPMAGLSLSQFEAILIAPNASHSAFPLALTMIVANVWLHRSPAVRYLSGGIAAVALTFTGFGIFSGAVISALLVRAIIRHLVIRQGKASIFATVGLALAMSGWIAFSSDYIFAPAVNGFKFPWSPGTDYLRFIVLMVVYPTGVTGESASHYVAGGLIAFVLLITISALGWRWITTMKNSLREDALILLLGSGILFVCNTAVGRVPLGVTAGMSSRYVTLMFPLWLGLYIAGSARRRTLPTVISAIVVGWVAVCPYRDLLWRPRVQWLGTIGATREQYAFFEEYTVRKAAWVDTYLKSGRWQSAQEIAGDAVYPDPGATRMDEKLGFLRAHRLSFFKTPGGAPAFLPWELKHRTIWDNEFPSINVSHPLEQRERTITYITKNPGFIEVEVRSGATREVSPVDLEFSSDRGTEVLTFTKLPEWVALPVSPGFNRLKIRRVQTDPTAAAEIPIELEMRGLNAPSNVQRAILR
ncbi:MAG: hypothetical protein ABIV50_14840 [Opitutus sp.]